MEILINGCVDTTDNPITVDEFNDKFIQWIESNGWYFGGGVNEYKEEHKEIYLLKYILHPFNPVLHGVFSSREEVMQFLKDKNERYSDGWDIRACNMNEGIIIK